MDFEYKLEKLLTAVNNKIEINNYVFLSLGKPNIKAQVKLFKKTNYIKQDISKSALKFKKKTGQFPEWIKLDIVTSTEKVQFTELKKTLINTRRNYVDFGIAFDSLWNLAVLPEEINANAFVRPDNTTKELFLSDKNINNYLRKYTTNKKAFSSEFYDEKEVVKFYTQGFFIDNEEVYELYNNGYRKGLRKVDHLGSEIDQLIESSTHFLQNMLLDNGKYIYGYFPHFDNEIGFYNILRHSSSTYALIEGLAYLGESLQPVEKANEDSLTLLKSSVTGTDFPEIAKSLPNILRRNDVEFDFDNLFEKLSQVGESYIRVNNDTGQIIEEFNSDMSQTIEGMGPLIYYLKAIDEKLENRKINMKSWSTNSSKTGYVEGREIYTYTLLKNMTNSPHPSEIYELANELFENHVDRKKYTKYLIEKLKLSSSIATNLTGRFRIKDRQSYTVKDLYQIYKYYKYDLFKFNNSFILGLKYKSGFIRGEKETIIFTSYQDPKSDFKNF
ncbi:hypothetical protein [Staphylococcus hominis]|uniref:hypothetical protein n=1 Tax=Staphylococcus hominis TaxID=1290 RepID=UPI0039B4E87C